ncbi:MAG: hypothetical protein K0B01_01180 [Syntrophobacterales bacterium]|nr:hypothetical protein [Syntrophobacterales bacterium]
MKEIIAFPIFQKASDKSLSVKIPQKASGQLLLTQKGQKATDQFRRIVQNPSAQLVISATPSRKSPFALGWPLYALPDWVREQEAGV